MDLLYSGALVVALAAGALTLLRGAFVLLKRRAQASCSAGLRSGLIYRRGHPAGTGIRGDRSYLATVEFDTEVP